MTANYQGDSAPKGCDGTTPSTTEGTAPVGTYSAGASKLGLMEMSGNVAEWTSTLKEETTKYYTKGGGWLTTAAGGGDGRSLSVAGENASSDNSQQNTLGFRCVKDISE